MSDTKLPYRALVYKGDKFELILTDSVIKVIVVDDRAVITVKEKNNE